jgi:hypothetical protein
MAIFYGSDTHCVTDVERIDRLVTDPRQLIGERIARLWQIPRGALGLINGDPNRGWDVTQYVNRKMTPNDIVIAQSQLQNEALKDEQVQSCDVKMTLSSSGTLTVTAQIVSSAGPFQFTLNVNQLTVEALFSF